eukprot:6979982-Pyramimonas_sp.AAC.1
MDYMSDILDLIEGWSKSPTAATSRATPIIHKKRASCCWHKIVQFYGMELKSSIMERKLRYLVEWPVR